MTYWIRRGAIVLVVITLIAALWWLIGLLRGGGSKSASTSNDPTSAASGTANPSDSASADPSAGSSGSPAAVENCPDSAIVVEATTDSTTYPVGSTPKLTMTITNTGDVACKRDVGPKANELEITSGGYHVWSSDDCNAASKSKVSTLQPGEKFAASITWNGHLSQPNCPNAQGAEAKAGNYKLTGRNLKVTSDPTPFALTAN